MKTFLAFLRKEWTETIRTGRLIVLLLIFLLFGIMNPAIAKLTPWMMEMMADSLEGSGLAITEIVVDAMTSWTQFYKNLPLALIVFVLLCSSTFTGEYQKGTLIQVVTKGLSRRKILIAKTLLMFLLWSVCYWLCYGVTFAYNAYFWDNSIASNLTFSVVCYWLFGLWVIAVMVFFSCIAKSTTTVLLGTGGVVLISYLAGLLKDVKDYVPTKLMGSMELLIGAAETDVYLTAIIITIVSGIFLLFLSIIAFNKRAI